MQALEVFGSLTAIRRLHQNKRGEYLWEFHCKCGKTHIAVGTVIKRQAKIIANPYVPSCGCVNVEVAIKSATKHGYAGHPLYTVFRSIRSRCYNKNNCRYPLYGGLGVTICNEWLANPGKFIEWALANGWQPGLQIDKDILCDKLNIRPKIYAPNVCQFVSLKMNTNYACSRKTASKDSKNIIISSSVADEIIYKYSLGNVSQRALAQEYSVSQNTICRIVNSITTN